MFRPLGWIIFSANSTTVQRRIAKAYRRTSDVIHPPVAVESFSASGIIGDYYLYCGQLVPYKRADIAVQAFNRLGKKACDGRRRQRKCAA